jgi:hypothetical protein
MPVIQATRDYQYQALLEKTVAVLPLAAIGEYDDKRAGVVLSAQSRAQASSAACEAIADSGDVTVTCIDQKAVARSHVLSNLQTHYALDQPVSCTALRRVRVVAKADFLLVFRPEGVSASQVVRSSTITPKNTGYQPYDFSPNPRKRPPRSSLSVERLMDPKLQRPHTRNTSARGMTIAAALLDLQRCKLVKTGTHHIAHQKTVRRNVGIAETPDVVPLLEDLMTELGEQMLYDPQWHWTPPTSE